MGNIKEEILEELEATKKRLRAHELMVTQFPDRERDLLAQRAELDRQLEFLRNARDRAPQAIRRLRSEIHRLQLQNNAVNAVHQSLTRSQTPRSDQDKFDHKLKELRDLLAELPPGFKPAS